MCVLIVSICLYYNTEYLNKIRLCSVESQLGFLFFLRLRTCLIYTQNRLYRKNSWPATPSTIFSIFAPFTQLLRRFPKLPKTDRHSSDTILPNRATAIRPNSSKPCPISVPTISQVWILREFSTYLPPSGLWTLCLNCLFRIDYWLRAMFPVFSPTCFREPVFCHTRGIKGKKWNRRKNSADACLTVPCGIMRREY